MKWLRISVLASATVGFLGLAVFWARLPAGFTTPAACLDAYREATRSGNVREYLRCFAQARRTEIEHEHADPKKLAESLRQETKDIKTWVQLPASGSDGSTAEVNVDEVRIGGKRRLHFRLQRLQTGWLIVGIDPPNLVPAGIPYGTHVSKVPEEMEAGSRP
jgi:hypothetical protein